nr:M1 family peptidase [Cytophagales bacterium]
MIKFPSSWVRNTWIFLLYTGIFLLSRTTGLAQEDNSWNWGGPMDPLQQLFRVSHYHLELEVFPETQEIAGSTLLSIRYLAPTDTLRLDLVDHYAVTAVADEAGNAFEFAHEGDLVDIFLTGRKPEKVKVSYEGKTPIAANPPWSGGFTWEKDSNGNHWMGLSSQNEGGKVFMPCLDHPKNKAAAGVSMNITVPSPYMVAANGLLTEMVQQGETTSFRWESRYPIMNYNINFTMGRLHEEKAVFHNKHGEEIPLVVFVLEENKDKAPMLLEVLRTSAETHEHFFGPFPFPKDKIAVVETPYLGMEHQTINAYGNNFQFVRMGQVWYDWLLHHELGHEWFGNKVSVSDWADYWIHEGITSYGDWLFYLKHEGEEAYLAKVADAKKKIKNEQPVVSPPDSHSDIAYHSDVYTKGAFIMHSLRFLLGDEVFFPMLLRLADHSAITYANQAATEDLITFISKDSGRDVRPFLERYLYRADLPKVVVRKTKRNTYQLYLQDRSLELPVEIRTDKGIQTVTLSSKPLEVVSKAAVKVDPNGWYLFDK